MVITFIDKRWSDSILTRLSRTVTYTPVTKTTDNMSGDETLTDGSPSSKSCVFFKKGSPWTFTKEGLFNLGDAFILVNATAGWTPAKNDKITVDGETYRVDEVRPRYSDASSSTLLYNFAIMFQSA